METTRLKKRLLKEELRRRYPNRVRNRWIAAVAAVAVIAGGSALYYHKRDDLLQERFNRAVSMMREGRFERSAQKFLDIYESRPHSKLAPKALFNRGEVFNISLKRYQEALVAYLQLLKQYPDSELALRSQERVAEIYKYRLQDNSSAIVAYQSLLDMGAEDRAEIQYEIADSYFKLNNFEQSRIEFEGFLKDNPDSGKTAEVNFRIGVCLSLEGQLKKSEVSLRQVIDSWPDDSYSIEARFALAEVLEEQERLKDSLQIFEALQGVYPNGEVLEKKMSQVKERIKKKKKAI